MKRRVVLEKPIGETPLAALTRWKDENSEYKNVPASYAGRLDPMASGKLLILLGDECKKQKSYTNLDKEYEVEVLLGVGSDTGDILGLVECSSKETNPKVENVLNVLKKEHGTHLRTYPTFSSKTVKGKPLFQYFYEGMLSEIEIPTHEERIYRIQHQGTDMVSTDELQKRVNDLLQSVPRTEEPSKWLGENFRIDAVRESWNSVFKNGTERKWTVLRLRIISASGTYMRSLAGRIGESLGTKALALSIHRTKIGKYIPVWRSVGFWYSVYV